MSRGTDSFKPTMPDRLNPGDTFTLMLEGNVVEAIYEAVRPVSFEEDRNYVTEETWYTLRETYADGQLKPRASRSMTDKLELFAYHARETGLVKLIGGQLYRRKQGMLSQEVIGYGDFS